MAKNRNNYIEPNADIRVKQAERLRDKCRESSIYMTMIILYITAIIWAGGNAVYAMSWFVASSVMVVVSYMYTKFQSSNEFTEENVDDFLKGHVIVSSFTGAVWGFLVIYFIDFTSSLSLVAASAIVFAIALSGLVPGATYRPSYIGQATSMLVPFAVYILLFAEGPFRIAGIGVLILYISGVISSLRAQRVTDESILMSQLQELNTKVRGQNQTILRVSEEKTRFLAATSHDFSQPLHAQGYFIQALEKELDTPEQRTLLKKIETSWQHQKRLLQGLVEINQLESGTIVPKLKIVDLAQHFKGLVDEFEISAANKSIEFIVNLEQALVRSDPLLITRIVQNLLSNAFRYTLEGGSVSLTTGTQDGSAYIVISDTGQGIPRDKLNQIFEEYVQLQTTTRGGEQIGLGLGLSIVKRLSELLELDLDLHSIPDEGTNFTLQFQALDDGEVEDLPTKAKRHYFETGALVVLVDDETDIRQSMSALLSQWGFDLIVSATPKEALGLLGDHEKTPSLLIIDKRLSKGQSGIDLIRDLREEVNEEIPAILMSGDLATPNQGIPLDNVQFMGKPIEPNRLKDMMHDLLAGN